MKVTIEISEGALQLWFGADPDHVTRFLKDEDLVESFMEDTGALLDGARWTVEREGTE